MSDTTLAPTATQPLRRGLSSSNTRILSLAALIGILLLAAFLRFYNLDQIGDGNRYYTAAVLSMLQSPENFFFVAAEPGGSVTVDAAAGELVVRAEAPAVIAA